MSGFIPTPKKHSVQECSNYHTITLISHSSTLKLKVLQARLHQCMNLELPDVQTGFRKGRGTRDPYANNLGSLKKQEDSRKKNNNNKKKTPISALLSMPKCWTVWITINCRRF